MRNKKNPFLGVLAAMALAGALGACAGEATMTVGDTQTTPKEFPTTLPISYPSYVGKQPSPYDGLWKGYFIVDFKRCVPVLQTYLRLSFEISEGMIRRINSHNADGFVNKKGVYVASLGPGHSISFTFSGKIDGDRLDGTWNAWGFLCNGSVELVRATKDEPNYCVDRINGKPYASPEECRGIDQLLTRKEFEAGDLPAPRK